LNRRDNKRACAFGLQSYLIIDPALGATIDVLILVAGVVSHDMEIFL
jgi:hypothetical protein